MTVIHEPRNESRPAVNLPNLSAQLSQLLRHERKIANRGIVKPPELPAPELG